MLSFVFNTVCDIHGQYLSTDGMRRVCGLQTSELHLFFADDMVFASSACDLQHALGQFAAECEAPGMKVSTSKSEATVVFWKKVDCTLQIQEKMLSQNCHLWKMYGKAFVSLCLDLIDLSCWKGGTSLNLWCSNHVVLYPGLKESSYFH